MGAGGAGAAVITSWACVVTSAAGTRPGCVGMGNGNGSGLRGAGTGSGLTGAGALVGGGASVATTGTILLRVPVVLGLCLLLATRLAPWPDLGTSCVAAAGGCSSTSTTALPSIGLLPLARFATLTLLLTWALGAGTGALPVLRGSCACAAGLARWDTAGPRGDTADVTGVSSVGVIALPAAGRRLVVKDWGLGRCC